MLNARTVERHQAQKLTTLLCKCKIQSMTMEGERPGRNREIDSALGTDLSQPEVATSGDSESVAALGRRVKDRLYRAGKSPPRDSGVSEVGSLAPSIPLTAGDVVLFEMTGTLRSIARPGPTDILGNATSWACLQASDTGDIQSLYAVKFIGRISEIVRSLDRGANMTLWAYKVQSPAFLLKCEGLLVAVDATFDPLQAQSTPQLR
jgi:hypothetical protein